MWTPQGYYTGSPGADKIVGWQINKGPEHAADYVGAEQLREHLNRPDIVEKAIVLASAEQAVREAPGTSFKLADLLSRPVPRFRIVSPLTGSVQKGGRASVRIAVEATPDPVRLIRVQVNGRQVAEQTPAIDSGGFGAGERVLTVPLGKGRNEIRVTLTNAIGEKAETLTLSHDGDGDLDKRGTLHILAIGVNDYKRLGNICGKDGQGELRPGLRRRRREEARRRGGEAPRARATSGSTSACSSMAAKPAMHRPPTTSPMRWSCCGWPGRPTPWCCSSPATARTTAPTTASWPRMPPGRAAPCGAPRSCRGRSCRERWRLPRAGASCSSTPAIPAMPTTSASATPPITPTSSPTPRPASTRRQWRTPALGHGLFTYAVVEGLEGKAVLPSRGEISTQSLADYIVERVGAMAKALKGEQVPQYFKGRDAQDFVLARR